MPIIKIKSEIFDNRIGELCNGIQELIDENTYGDDKSINVDLIKKMNSIIDALTKLKDSVIEIRVK